MVSGHLATPIWNTFSAGSRACRDCLLSATEFNQLKSFLLKIFPMPTPGWHASCHLSFIEECPTKTRILEGVFVKAEQRQHPRYRIRDAVFHVLSQGDRITGRLVNIGKGGLAFQFAPGQGKTGECRAIHILGPEPDRLHVSGISSRKIYEIGALAQDQPFTGAETRLCGPQFIDLTHAQSQKRTVLIDRYGRGVLIFSPIKSRTHFSRLTR
jgi:hypothetical protein